MNRQALFCVCSSTDSSNVQSNASDKTSNVFAFEPERGYTALILRGAANTSISPKAFCFDKSRLFGFSADFDKPNKLSPFVLTPHDSSSVKVEQLNKGWFVPGVVLCSLYCRSLNMLIVAVGNHIYSWDLLSGELLAKVRAHNFDVSHMLLLEFTISSDSVSSIPTLITFSNDLMLKFWNLRRLLTSSFTNTPAKADFMVKLPSRLVAMDFSCIGDIFTITADNLCRLYNTRAVMLSSYASASNSTPTALCTSSTGLHVFLGFNNGRVEQLLTCREEAEAFNISNPERTAANFAVCRVMSAENSSETNYGPVSCMQCDAQCLQLAVAQRTRVSIYDIFSGQSIKVLPSFTNNVERLSFFSYPAVESVDFAMKTAVTGKVRENGNNSKQAKLVGNSTRLPALLERKLSEFEHVFYAV